MPGRRPDGGDERGVAVILLALTITSVLVAAAFAVDLGWWYVRAEQAQRAADAASLAGVVWMPDLEKARSVALASAEANGFRDGVDDISVLVTRGSSDRQLAVRVVDAGVARFFSSVASNDQPSIGRQAMARYDLPVPLGGSGNQLGGGLGGVDLDANAYAISPPSGSTARNLDRRASGSTYVVAIPPGRTGPDCAVRSPPSGCSRTASTVTIEVQDPTPDTGDQDASAFASRPSGCGPGQPDSWSFSVHAADGTPLDTTDNPLLARVDRGLRGAASTGWDVLATVPAGSRAGRYLVRVQPAPSQACAAGSSAFGLRARVGGTFARCTTTPTPRPTPSTAGCPQVHGLEAMSLRLATAGASGTCAGVKETGSNTCTSFPLAQVDPALAGRQMVINLFDPGDGARRMRVLAPDRSPVGFGWRTADDQPSASGHSAASTGLNMLARTPASTTGPFDDRMVELSVTLPDAAGLSANGGWFKVEYEVSGAGPAGLVDRTTWAVSVRGAPVRLVR